MSLPSGYCRGTMTAPNNLREPAQYKFRQIPANPLSRTHRGGPKLIRACSRSLSTAQHDAADKYIFPRPQPSVQVPNPRSHETRAESAPQARSPDNNKPALRANFSGDQYYPAHRKRHTPSKRSPTDRIPPAPHEAPTSCAHGQSLPRGKPTRHPSLDGRRSNISFLHFLPELTPMDVDALLQLQCIPNSSV